jgi:hypothetical protein
MYDETENARPIDPERVTRTVGAMLIILGEDLSADMSYDRCLEALNALGVLTAFVVHCADDRGIEALTFFNEVVSRNVVVEFGEP